MSFLTSILANKLWLGLIVAGIVIISGSSVLGWRYYQKKAAQKIAQEQPPASTAEQPVVTPTEKTTTSKPAEKPTAGESSQPAPAGQTAPGATPTSQPTAAKTINDTATKFEKKTFGYCAALAPADWATTTNAEATGADLWSPDKSLHAGWGIAATYTYLSGSPDEGFFNQWMPLAGYSGFSWASSARDVGYDFKERDFASSGKKGTILYKTYNIDSTSYINSVYMADADAGKWGSQGHTPAYVAVSIRCTSQLRPETSSSTGSSSSRSNNKDVDISDKWTEAIMGYENVYSPSTGEHYEAPLNSKWDTGPDGSGYYRSVPNGYEKLERGFGSY